MTKNIINESFKTNKFNEKYLYSVNRNTFLKESSQSIFKRHFSDKLDKEESLFIFFGTDSGLLPRFILSEKTPRNTRFLFIELPHVLEKIIEDFSDIDEDIIRFATPNDWEKVAGELELSLYIYKDKVKYLKSLAVVDSYLVEYSATNVKIVKELEVNFFFTRATVGVFPFMTKQLMNITENKYPSSILDNVFKDRTCIILGGGPSLDNDIEWIKYNQKNIVIIAVSRIARTLLKHNLTPHIIVSVDPYDVSFDVSKELLNLPKEVIFLQANCVHPSLLSQWHGKSIYIGARYPWEESSDEGCNTIGGPTVTNTALKSAIEMGFTNILLSGVDLCYSQTGITYAKDSNEASIGPTLGEPGILVNTYAGYKAETLIEYDNAVLALSQQATEALKQGINIYNLSINAAIAENVVYIPTEALSFENEKEDIWELISKVIPDYTSEFIKKDNNLVLSNASKMLKDIQEIKILAEEALLCNKKLFQSKGKESENYKFKIRMDKIEKKFNIHYKKSSAFVKNFGLDKFITAVQTSHEDWSDEQIEETGRIYYQAYLDSSEMLIEHLQATTKRIKSRIEEEKKSPNLDLLFNQWAADQHFGRAAVWIENPRINTPFLPDQIKEKQEKFINNFNKIIDERETPHLERAKRHASLTNVKRKIIVLFHQHNIDGLNVMAKSLQQFDNKHDEFNKAQELFTLSMALSSMLLKDYNSALTYFDSLPEEKIEEDELQQIISILLKLKLYNRAEITLKSLSNISNIYTQQYAKILHLLGKSEKSIEVYTQYLEENPKSVSAWIALAKIHIDLGSEDSAKMALQYALLIEPQNNIAQEYLATLH